LNISCMFEVFLRYKNFDVRINIWGGRNLLLFILAL